jgi:hypothetical protein
MRDCPNCNYPFRSVKVREYNKTSLINAGLTAPVLSLCACEMCGMMYVDGGQVDQAWFDWYYLNHYKTDDKPYSDARLKSLAKCVDDYLPLNRNPIVLDIGGTDGELMERLDKLDIVSHTLGVGDEASFRYYRAVILSHTLEHIYDVPAMFQRIRSALVPGGLLFIEVPIWLDYLDLNYDRHWQHTNKFRSIDLENILRENDFDIVFSDQIEDYREYHVWRIIGRMK